MGQINIQNDKSTGYQSNKMFSPNTNRQCTGQNEEIGQLIIKRQHHTMMHIMLKLKISAHNINE
jgi:hypothetical protein